MKSYETVLSNLMLSQRTWLITGVAGFIGSNLLESLLKLNQRVVGLDNFATGHRHNLEEVKSLVSTEQWKNFHFIEGDIRDIEQCRNAMSWRNSNDEERYPVDYVLHQAALGSVPRSLADPISTNFTNISGFLNVLVAARDAAVQSFVYAASSSTYGDHPGLPKVEELIGKPLSPYAVTKYVNELYAEVFCRCYDFKSVGLRYFNVFGKRQDPNGAYAAVIPKWTAAMINNEDVFINGDGETSRDFCYVDNVVQANILAATTISAEAQNQIYNIAVSGRASLNDLFEFIKLKLAENGISYSKSKIYRDFRSGDVRHSQASIEKAKKLLGYDPQYDLVSGLSKAMPWYCNFLTKIY